MKQQAGKNTHSPESKKKKIDEKQWRIRGVERVNEECMREAKEKTP